MVPTNARGGEHQLHHRQPPLPSSRGDQGQGVQEVGHQHEIAPGVGVGIALHYALEGKSSGTVQITGNSQGEIRVGREPEVPEQHPGQQAEKPARVSRRAKRVLA